MRFHARILTTGVPLPPAGGELRRLYLFQEGTSALKRARKLYGQSLRAITVRADRGLLDLPPTYIEFLSRSSASQTIVERLLFSYRDFQDKVLVQDDDRNLAERLARQALDVSISAFNFLEDDILSMAAHDLFHEIGAYVGGMFGCELEADKEGVYWNRCAVSLAHRRYGFSVGMSHDVLCSVCHEDIDDCKHFLGRTYPTEVTKTVEGKCGACGRIECAHETGSIVEIYSQPVLSGPALREVTVTPRPRDPLARLDAVEIATSSLIETLGQDPAGKKLRCTCCLEPCPGFIETSSIIERLGDGANKRVDS
ncbi:hypothetical protein [Actinophytocola glycyrrhizae]|uniref:Uncharacterized protein n=1 Tax=Actinophytocola glycyrrhizae TaxID=2044873 RepID=A0ABV9SEB4_9PSEU